MAETFVPYARRVSMTTSTGPFVERSPSGAHMKHHLCEPENKRLMAWSMSRVVGATPVSGAPPKDPSTRMPWAAVVPDSKWVPMSKAIGAFTYVAPQPGLFSRSSPHIDSSRPVSAPVLGMDGNGLNLADNKPKHGNFLKGGRSRENESILKPDPSWGYTGSQWCHRYDEGQEKMSSAQRIARRRLQAIERRFGVSPQASKLVAAAALPQPIMPPHGPFGWAAWPPKGLDVSHSSKRMSK